MFWAGSLMSQVLQCTQFCALIWKRLLPSSLLITSYTPAGQYRWAGSSYFGRLCWIGMFGSVSLRWTGWFSSWLVLDRNTEDSLSKLSLPSGFGYSIFWLAEASFRQAWSGL